MAVLAAATLLFLLALAALRHGEEYARKNLYERERLAMTFDYYDEATDGGWSNLGGFILLLSASSAAAGLRLWACEAADDFSDNRLTTLRLAPARARQHAPRPTPAPTPARAVAAGTTRPPRPRFAHFDERGRTPLERALADGRRGRR